MSDYFIFDDIDTRNYDDVLVYFNEIDTTPKRVGEFIEIPNRNGSFFLDGGRYEDVTHVYDIVALSKADASDLINALASKVGYFKLQDSFNSDEYYSAVFDSKVEPNVTKERDKLTFKLTFTRKPQRWLTSGETAVTVTSGDTLTNPTLFESSPLLEVGGSGSIQFNGYEIEFEGVPYGEIVICPHTAPAGSTANPYTVTATLDTSLLNIGDPIYPEAKDCQVRSLLSSSGSSWSFESASVGTATNVLDAEVEIAKAAGRDKLLWLYLYPDFGEGFVYGTAKTIVSTVEYNYRIIQQNKTETVQVTITYGGADSYTIEVSRTGYLSSAVNRGNSYPVIPIMYADSSKPNPAPIFIDCDLGEAYTNEGGVYRSLNQYIDLGSELPKLASGSNTVTFDNTITELKVTPRYWKV